jgi:pyruvate/2-oxoglutarate dehydrogenase complex dihydrolipoamide acyltransferase (E2) component
MNSDVLIPHLPEPTMSALVTKIYVTEGQHVKKDDTLLDVETDKIVLEIVATANGVVTKININEGEQVSSNQVVMLFEYDKPEFQNNTSNTNQVSTHDIESLVTETPIHNEIKSPAPTIDEPKQACLVKHNDTTQTESTIDAGAALSNIASPIGESKGVFYTVVVLVIGIVIGVTASRFLFN